MSVLRFSMTRDAAPGQDSFPWEMFAEGPGQSLIGNARNATKLERIEVQNADRPFHDQPLFNDDSALSRHFRDDLTPPPAEGPVIVFVHGFWFEVRDPNVDPWSTSDNPHARLYSFNPSLSQQDENDQHATPLFARALTPDGMGGADDSIGTAIGFGYTSDGDTGGGLGGFLDLANATGGVRNFYSLAYRDAGAAGHALAGVIAQTRRWLDAAGRTEQPIDIVSHSLGTRTAMKALEVLALRQRDGHDTVLQTVDRVLCLAGACLWEQAGETLARIAEAAPATMPQVFNVYSTKDSVVEKLGSRASLRTARAEIGRKLTWLEELRVFFTGGKTIGIDGKPARAFRRGGDYARWVDIDLSRDAIRRWGIARNISLLGEIANEKDHWVHYTHRGNWDLYRRILQERQGWSVEDLAASLP